MKRIILFVLCLLLVQACSDGSNSFNPNPPAPGPTYSTDIVYTEYGILHVTADNWGGLGYGYGISDEASGIASGVLYGNPHFPWQGPNRFFMSHLTIAGVYDAMGAALHDLTLNPDNRSEYIVDGEALAFEPTTVTAEIVGDDGSVQAPCCSA